MKDPQRRSYPNAEAISRHPRLIMSTAISIGILLVFILSACSRDAVSPSSIPTLTQSSQVSSTTNYPIKVFFSKSPQSLNTNFTAVYPVDRSSPTLALGNFAIQLLIAGPTPAEQQAGYFTELNTMLSGPSKCTALPVGGPDFTLAMDMKGPATEKGTATLKFCRSLSSAGIGADARVQAEIDTTLKQFATIKKVIILLEGGDCFGDMSGQNLCLN